jgi:hypothetical protein
MKTSSNHWNLAARCLMPVSVLLIAGCGGSADNGRGIPVSGTVTMNGAPIEGANVTFLNDTFAGFARTDSNGRYRLVQGALPGTNKIVISKMEDGVEAIITDVDSDSESVMDAGQIDAAAMGLNAKGDLPKNLFPDEYGDPVRTRLTFEVPKDGATGVDFNL